MQDAYKSIVEAIIHAGANEFMQSKSSLDPSEKITAENVEKKLEGLKGIIVAPGFGHRGIEGKIIATQYVREHNIPFFGICLGMQIAVIEFARNVFGSRRSRFDRNE